MVGRLAHYAVGAVLVRLADEGARVALLLLAVQRTGSAATGGALVAALLVPHVVAAPVVGLLTDRASRPRLVVAGAALGFGCALDVTAAGLGRLPLPVVLAVLVAGGCCGPALTGGLTSQLSALVPGDRLPRAFGLDSLTYNSAGIIGPAAAAVLATSTSPALATAALATGAAVGAVLIAVLPIRPHHPRPCPPAGGQLLAGGRILVRNRVLAAVTGATCLGQVGLGALPVIAVLLAEQHQHPAAAGWLLTSVAAGGLVGSLAWTWRPAAPDHAPTVVMSGLAAAGIPLAVAAVLPSGLQVTTVLFAVSGFSTGPLFGALLLTRHHHAPTALRTQVFTLGAGAKITATAAGAAVAGAPSGHAPAALLLLAGACPVAAGVLGQLSLRTHRWCHRGGATTEQHGPERDRPPRWHK